MLRCSISRAACEERHAKRGFSGLRTVLGDREPVAWKLLRGCHRLTTMVKAWSDPRTRAEVGPTSGHYRCCL